MIKTNENIRGSSNDIIEQINKIKYLTFGSPIIDIIADVEKDFIEKFNLKLDTTSHADKNDRVFSEIKKLNHNLVLGGCSYNAIRVLNWMMSSLTKDYAFQVGCLGSIGKDDIGLHYKQQLEEEKIVHLFEEFEGDSGKCATIIEGRERCHITDLGASTKITEEYVNLNWDSIKDVKLIYTELYILSARKSVLLKLADLCLNDDKLFGFNFPSIGFLDAFSNDIKEMIEYGDILFANKEEARHFVSNVLKYDYPDNSNLAEILAKLPKKNKNKKRVFIVTCGPEPAFVAVYNPATEIMEFSGSFLPLFVEFESIIDTNGAGDSFAGAFLAYYCQGYPIESCVKAGHWAAAEIIKVRGCNIPSQMVPPEEKKLLKMFNKQENQIEDYQCSSNSLEQLNTDEIEFS